MLWGALRLRQLIDMVQRMRKQDTFFVDLSPANLRFDKSNTEIAPVITSYKSEEDYLRAVRSGSAWRMEGFGDTDNFVPIYRRFNTRAVEVDSVDDEAGSSGYVIRVRHAESLPIWRGINQGDLLRTVDRLGRSRLYHIVSVHQRGAWNVLEINNVVIGADETQRLSDGDMRDTALGMDIPESGVGDRPTICQLSVHMYTNSSSPMMKKTTVRFQTLCGQHCRPAY